MGIQYEGRSPEKVLQINAENENWNDKEHRLEQKMKFHQQWDLVDIGKRDKCFKDSLKVRALRLALLGK